MPVLTESEDFTNPAFNIAGVANDDIGDFSNGATTNYSGSSAIGGTNAGNMNDGTLHCDPTCTGMAGSILMPDVGGILEIFLDTTVNTGGYNITSLVNTTGWDGSSRTNHQYDVALRPIGGSYGEILNVEYPVFDPSPAEAHNSTPEDLGMPGVQLTINDDQGGFLGSGIDAIRYTFHNQNTGTSPEAYQEFDVFGTLAPPLPIPTEYQWSLAGLGDWNNRDSWTPDGIGGTIPNLNEHTAVFGDAIQGPSTVTADVPITVNRIQFDNATNTYAVGGLGGITLAATDAGGTPSISVLGTHEFQTRVDLQADTLLDVAAGSTLSFNNALNLNGFDLNLIGGGTVNVNNVINAGGGTVNLNGGTLGGGGEVGGNVFNLGGFISPGSNVAPGAAGQASVPEPSSLLVLLTGLIGLSGVMRSRR